MPFAEPPPLEPRTAMWGMALRFQVISSRFNSLYENTRDIWLIGLHLSWPFYLLSTYFTKIANFCFQVDDKLVNVISWVKGIVEGDTLRQLLESLSFDLRYLLRDPFGWFLYRLDDISIIYRQLRDDPYGFIKNKLFASLPIFWDIIYNTRNWLFEKLREMSGDLVWFISNPFDYLRYALSALYNWFYLLDLDPVSAIIDWLSGRIWWFRDFLYNPSNRIIQFIRDYNWELSEFISNPIRWVKERVYDSLELDMYSTEPITLLLIRKIINQLTHIPTNVVDTLFTQFVDFIIRFI
jgi:hypothetical protein